MYRTTTTSQESNDCNQFLQRTFRIRTFSSGSASAKKFDVLIKNKERIERLQPLKSPMTAISFYSALLELEHSVPVQPQLKKFDVLIKKKSIERLQLSQESNDCNQFLQRTFRIRTFSSGSASAKKFDVLIKKKRVSNDYNSLKSGMTAISFYSALLELEHSVPVQPQLKNLTFL